MEESSGNFFEPRSINELQIGTHDLDEILEKERTWHMAEGEGAGQNLSEMFKFNPDQLREKIK